MSYISIHVCIFFFSFREWCYKIVKSKVFTTVTLVVVLLSSLILTAEVPLGVREDEVLCSLQTVIVYLDCFFMVYFFIEMALKVHIIIILYLPHPQAHSHGTLLFLKGLHRRLILYVYIQIQAHISLIITSMLCLIKLIYH